MTLAEQWIQEGRQEGRRRAILDLLEGRLGKVPVRVRDLINTLGKDSDFKKAMVAAFRSASFQEFRAALHA